MDLIQHLRAAAEHETSYFRSHLLKEDVARLERAASLARMLPDEASYLAQATKLGWTADDRRTHELMPALKPFLIAFRRAETGGRTDIGPELLELWRELDTLRMARLVGCLSRVPTPE
ncbi:MAG TPA: hypothetical protein PK264_23680 [Hyphomicrobiaceae bacterium]|nr:hypothetical protein [Hyphomicrobiaceae bacterium]